MYLVARFTTRGASIAYTAITDGQVQHAVSYEIAALLECKKRQRVFHTPAIEIQETSQVIAWILKHPDTSLQRIIISQDGNEIYLTFPEFDQFWLRYIQDGRLDKAGHMTEKVWSMED
ncbi:hypothetical protein BDW42DRAFT_129025 [Aspergillus taichungensis]|uniref:Uncharacterized protein n=1 Tax=Aspergillus taichungensis TaxID=482145 RepID=A0A2J5HPY9_9EURO|nr:hypothetical protein BDW42DRAFT_129025 [Aspergillus taichungensis]